MRSTCSLGVLLIGVLLGGLVNAAPTHAAARPLTLCAIGCDYSDLGAALAAAPEGAKIIIGPGTYTGGINITKDVTLQGAGAADTTFVGGPIDPEVWWLGRGPVLTIGEAARVRIQGVTLTGGLPEHFGGAIYNAGNLTLKQSVLRENRAGSVYDGYGGGIYNASSGTLTVVGTSIRDNGSNENGGSGGGIFNEGTATVIDSAIADNWAAFVAGAIVNHGTMTLRNSTVNGNGTFAPPESLFAVGIANTGTLNVHRSVIADNGPFDSFGLVGWGGGIANWGTTALYDSIVTGNRARYGGGLMNFGGLSLSGTTVMANTAVVGGGLYNIVGEGTYELHGSVVSGNTGGDVFVGDEPCNIFCS